MILKYFFEAVNAAEAKAAIVIRTYHLKSPKSPSFNFFHQGDRQQRRFRSDSPVQDRSGGRPASPDTAHGSLRCPKSTDSKEKITQRFPVTTFNLSIYFSKILT